MPRPKAVASLSRLENPDMEEDTMMQEAFPTPESNQENAAPTRQRSGNSKTESGVQTKAKGRPRRTSGGPFAGRKRAAQKKVAAKRAPLKEQSANHNADDTEEVNDFEEKDHNVPDTQYSVNSADELVAVKQPAKKAKAVAKGKKVTNKKQLDSKTLQQIKATANDGEFEYTPTSTRQTKPAKKDVNKPSTAQRGPYAEPPHNETVIPETQIPPMEVDAADFNSEEEEVPQSVFRPTNNAVSRAKQQQPSQKQAGSASDMERDADDAIRRKLGDMTKRFENLDMKYRNLREVGIKEAELNYERLKATSEAKTKTANELIASLKKELATQQALAQESRSLQRQIIARDADVAKVQALATELSSSLSEVQNENRALQAKLANSRNASVSVENANSKTPGSAIQGKAQNRTVMVGSVEAAQAAQVAQLKEDLYSDLTGLILRGVEKGSEVDIYDCIQTGRNGTLHFKLAIANTNEGNYGDAEFQYTPLLDEDRDRDLLELLPDYLSEEITFSRLSAAKFYGRVIETLTKKAEENQGQT